MNFSVKSIRSVSGFSVSLFLFFCPWAHSCLSLWLTALFLTGLPSHLGGRPFPKGCRVLDVSRSIQPLFPGHGLGDSVSFHLQDTGGLEGWLFHQLSIHATATKESPPRSLIVLQFSKTGQASYTCGLPKQRICRSFPTSGPWLLMLNSCWL